MELLLRVAETLRAPVGYPAEWIQAWIENSWAFQALRYAICVKDQTGTLVGWSADLQSSLCPLTKKEKMTKRKIAALACKIVGIYAIVNALGTLQGAFQYLGVLFSVMSRQSDPELKESIEIAWVLVATFAPFVLLVASGILLWFLADRLGARMTSGVEAPSVEPKIVGESIQAIAFSVIGLFVLAQAIPRVTQLVINLSFRDPQIERVLRSGTKALIGALVVQLVIGVWLLFGSRGLVGVLKTVREAGLRKSENSSE